MVAIRLGFGQGRAGPGGLLPVQLGFPGRDLRLYPTRPGFRVGLS